MKNRIVWADTETTGLDTEKDLLLEIGLIVTEADLTPVACSSWVLGYSRDQLEASLSDFTREMHTANGLIAEVLKGCAISIAGAGILAFLNAHTEGAPVLAGSTIGFDRAFVRRYFPAVVDRLHYRSIDVSSFKEIGRAWGLPAWSGSGGSKAHRAIADAEASIQELAFYRSAWGLGK